MTADGGVGRSSELGYPTFGVELLEFLRVLHVEPEEFHPQKLADEPIEELKIDWLHISRSQVFNILKGKPARLRHGMAQRLAGRADVFLQREVTRHRATGTLDRFEKVITKFSFVRFRNGRWTVDAGRLAESYEHSKRVRHSGPTDPPRQTRVHLELILDQSAETLSSETMAAQIKKLVDANQYSLLNVTEGCTRVVIEVSFAQAQAIKSALAFGQIELPTLLAVREIDGYRHFALSKLFGRDLGPLDPSASNAAGTFKKCWRRIMLQEEFVRPWRRFRYLVSPHVRSCPLAHVISESNDRAYASPHLKSCFNSLIVDLEATLLLWPLLAYLLLASIFFLLPSNYPIPSVNLGIFTGITLALLGAQPCSILISPLACGAGTVAMAIAFGLVQTAILGRVEASALLGQVGIRHDFFVSIAGGLVGLSAPVWRATFSVGSIIFIVSAIALSIAAAGWLMGQPLRAKAQDEHPGVLREIDGGLLGAAAGSGIGLTYLLNRILAPTNHEPNAFILAFALTGGIWMAVATFIQTRQLSRSVSTAAFHVLVASILFKSVFSTAGGSLGLLTLAAASGYFHSTWFTAAFIVGQWRGGVRAAFVATTLEGSVGFAVFVLARILRA